MPFMKFGKKKDKKEDDDLEVEESGLLMSTKGEQPASAAESGPDAASPQPLDDLDPGAAGSAETPGGEAGEEGDSAALADPLAEDKSAAEAPAETENKESDAADLMSAFQTDEVSDSDLADLLVGVEVVAASVLLEELREVRSMLPPGAATE